MRANDWTAPPDDQPSWITGMRAAHRRWLIHQELEFWGPIHAAGHVGYAWPDIIAGRPHKSRRNR